MLVLTRRYLLSAVFFAVSPMGLSSRRDGGPVFPGRTTIRGDHGGAKVKSAGQRGCTVAFILAAPGEMAVANAFPTIGILAVAVKPKARPRLQISLIPAKRLGNLLTRIIVLL